MRTITSTLLAAARSLAGRPSIHLTVDDRAVRWRALHTLVPAVDCPCVASACNGSLIVRAGVDGSGNLYYQVIHDAALAAPWQTWTLLAAGASRANGDVAVAWHALAWCIYYQRSDHWIMMVRSIDDGATWSAASQVYHPSRTAALAAAGPHLFALEDALRVYQLQAGGASWSGPYTLPGVAPASDLGVAACIQPTSGGGQMVPALFAMGGGIRAVRYDPAAHTFGAVTALTPGRDQELSASASCRWPALAALDETRLLATWVEQWSGDLDAWRHPVSRISVDGAGAHWGRELPLANPAETDRRMALAYDSLDEVLYAGNGERVLVAEMHDALLNPLSHLGPLEVACYRGAWRVTAPGRLHVALLDADGALAEPGALGEDGQALRPLAELTLARGYVTAAGAEEVALPPHYLVRARRTHGLGGGRVELEAVDALGLLELWSPPEPLEWRERTLRWLAAEVCAQGGLPWGDDGCAALGVTLERFTWQPGTTALAALHALLRLSGCVARAAAQGGVGALHLASHAPATHAALGEAGEVLRAAYGPGWPEATAIRVVGHDAWADVDDVTLGGELGLRLHRYIEDARITSAAVAETVRDRELRLASLAARADELTVPLRPELELWDVADVAGLGERVIVGLAEAWDGRRYESEVELGAW